MANDSPSSLLTCLPAGIDELLEVFATELPDLKFADLDRAAIEADAARVRASSEALASAEAAVELARAELTRAREHLVGRGQRALAYARIYADGAGDAELVTRLEAIPLGGAKRAETRPGMQGDLVPRRRGRPPGSAAKAAATEASAPLPLVAHDAAGRGPSLVPSSVINS